MEVLNTVVVCVLFFATAIMCGIDCVKKWWQEGK